MAYAVEWEIDLEDWRARAEADGADDGHDGEEDSLNVLSFPPGGRDTAR